MKGSDVVQQLAVLLPQRTGFFTDNQVATSAVHAGGLTTYTTPLAHGLLVGDAVAIEGAVTASAISSLTRSATVGTLVTTLEVVDLTNRITPTVTISGAVEAEFNGTFPLVNVDNGSTVRFTMVDAGPTTATGSPVLEGAESALRQYDGTYAVNAVPTTTTFNVVNSYLPAPLSPVGTINVRGAPRISYAVDQTRATAAYTQQNLTDYWLFVTLGDVESSKSRDVRSDARDNLTAGDNFRQQIIQPFSLFVFIPTPNDIGAGAARDLAEDMFQPICQSVLASQFDSGLFVGDEGAVQFVSHGTAAYDTSLYVHGFEFQQTVGLYEEDTVGPDLDVRSRFISLSMDPEITGSDNTTALTAVINLDDVPL